MLDLVVPFHCFSGLERFICHVDSIMKQLIFKNKLSQGGEKKLYAKHSQKILGYLGIAPSLEISQKTCSTFNRAVIKAKENCSKPLLQNGSVYIHLASHLLYKLISYI